jgi:hypothetical protein
VADPLPKPQHWFAPGANSIRDTMVKAFEHAKELSVGHAVEVIVRPVRSRRSLIQNAKMWAMLADIARQVEWPVNGVMQRLETEDWKSLITAAVNQEVRLANGLSGGVVMLGASTRKMTTGQMADVIEYLYAFGVERDVTWSKQAGQEVPEEWEST